MNKLHKTATVVLSSIFLFAGLSPVWAVNPKPRKLKKGNTKASQSALMRKVNRKVTMTDLRRTRKISARNDAHNLLADARKSLASPFGSNGVAAEFYAQQALEEAKRANLDLAPFEETLKQAYKTEAAHFLANAQLQANMGRKFWAEHVAKEALNSAQKAGLTGEALTPYKVKVESIQKELESFGVTKENGEDFDAAMIFAELALHNLYEGRLLAADHAILSAWEKAHKGGLSEKVFAQKIDPIALQIHNKLAWLFLKEAVQNLEAKPYLAEALAANAISYARADANSYPLSVAGNSPFQKALEVARARQALFPLNREEAEAEMLQGFEELKKRLNVGIAWDDMAMDDADFELLKKY